MSRLPLRVRLVAGFSLAMLVLLTAAGAFVYWRVEYALDRDLDSELSSASAVIEPLVGNDGTVNPRQSADATGAGWQVLDADGEVLDHGGPAPERPLVSDPRDGTYDVGSLLPVSDEPYRVRVTELSGGAASYLLVGARRDHRDEALRELLLQLTIAGLGALVVASVVGDLLARLALRPVEQYRRRAEEIASGAPGLRLDVPPDRDDEVTRLGHTLNDMLAALEESLERERQFVTDASHELRTPLTLLKSRIQLTRRRTRSVEEHERALDELEVDVARLADLAQQLLELDSRPGTATGDLAGATRAAALRLSDEVAVDAPESLRVHLDESALERIVTNLVANAITHGRPPVELRVLREGADGVLEVTDAGPGMSPELLDTATRRFSRAPEARSRPGAGLGLAIVEHVVTAAGGELRLDQDEHLTVRVVLPAAD